MNFKIIELNLDLEQRYYALLEVQNDKRKIITIDDKEIKYSEYIKRTDRCAFLFDKKAETNLGPLLGGSVSITKHEKTYAPTSNENSSYGFVNSFKPITTESNFSFITEKNDKEYSTNEDVGEFNIKQGFNDYDSLYRSNKNPQKKDPSIILKGVKKVNFNKKLNDTDEINIKKLTFSSSNYSNFNGSGINSNKQGNMMCNYDNDITPFSINKLHEDDNPNQEVNDKFSSLKFNLFKKREPNEKEEEKISVETPKRKK